MRLVALAWRYLWARPLVAAINLALLALGVAAMSFVVSVSQQVERSVQRDLAGIDLVVGAKGSPLQLILAGDQYNTISKPSEVVAEAAAKVAVALVNGQTPEAKTTLYDTPAELFVPAVVTKENIKAEIFDKGIQTYDQVCTGEYAAACDAAGISK